MNANIAIANTQTAPCVAQINAPTITAAISAHTSKAPKKLMGGDVTGPAGRIKPGSAFMNPNGSERLEDRPHCRY